MSSRQSGELDVHVVVADAWYRRMVASLEDGDAGSLCGRSPNQTAVVVDGSEEVLVACFKLWGLSSFGDPLSDKHLFDAQV